jgi:hypothetical protein
VARHCVRSRNLDNEEAKARYWAVKVQPQWVVMPGEQTNKHTNSKNYIGLMSNKIIITNNDMVRILDKLVILF